MKSESLVSVIVCKKLPFSSDILTLCLESIANQVYKNLEVIFVGSSISHNIEKIAESMGCKIVITKWNLLGARYAGLRASKGQWILFLDTNQILEKTAIKRAIKKISGFSMLCFEQSVYKPLTWIQKLYEADRKLINRSDNKDLNPSVLAERGASMATFYRRILLEELFKNINTDLFSQVAAHDHAIIFSEAYKISQDVGLLDKAILRIEPSNLKEFWLKNYEYKKTSQKLIEYGYSNLFYTYQKPKLRDGTFKVMNLHLGIQSIILLALKAVAIKAPNRKGK